MYNHTAGDKGTVTYLDVPGNQGATRDDCVVTDGCVMGNMARRHDVVAVADGGD
jgi:hypothetical protein